MLVQTEPNAFRSSSYFLLFLSFQQRDQCCHSIRLSYLLYYSKEFPDFDLIFVALRSLPYDEFIHIVVVSHRHHVHSSIWICLLFDFGNFVCVLESIINKFSE